MDVDYDINFVKYNGDEGEHTHRFVELVYILGGKGMHRINGKEYYVRRGDMLVINYHCRHEVEVIENHYYVDIMLKPEYISRILEGTDDFFIILQLSEYAEISNVAKDNVLIHFNAEEREKIDFLLNLSREEKDNKRPCKNLMIYSALSIILGMVFRKLAEDHGARLSVNDRLLGYIDKNCHAKLTVGELARMCGYTPEHFSRIFRDYTGISPIGYIIKAPFLPIPCQIIMSVRTVCVRALRQTAKESGFCDGEFFCCDSEIISGCGFDTVNFTAERNPVEIFFQYSVFGPYLFQFSGEESLMNLPFQRTFSFGECHSCQLHRDSGSTGNDPEMLQILDHGTEDRGIIHAGMFVKITVFRGKDHLYHMRRNSG